MAFKIQAWNQPNGPGYGWAPCSEAKAQSFFVFKDGISVGRQFATRAEAESWIKGLERAEPTPSSATANAR